MKTKGKQMQRREEQRNESRVPRPIPFLVGPRAADDPAMQAMPVWAENVLLAFFGVMALAVVAGYAALLYALVSMVVRVLS
jgi:hypothetical protein